ELAVVDAEVMTAIAQSLASPQNLDTSAAQIILKLKRNNMPLAGVSVDTVGIGNATVLYDIGGGYSDQGTTHGGGTILLLKLPALVDGDRVLTESVAIVLYVAEKYPDKNLLPRDIGARAECYRWLMFAATELEQPLWRIAKHTAILPKEKRIDADVALARED